jgi:hypothetical protein
MTKDETLRLALEALEYPGPSWIEARQPAITAIKAALEVKDEPKKFKALTTEEVEQAMEQSKGSPDRLKTFNALLDDMLWKKNKLKQYKDPK